MRAIFRATLGNAPRAFLESAQAELSQELRASVDEPEDPVRSPRRKKIIDDHWRRQRRRRTMVTIEQTLGTMAGRRARCMFCSDSRGGDMDHFWPKRYWARVFEWTNLLLVCAPCNRQKGDRFPLAEDGEPLLIDPTAGDPWEWLYYDSATHLLAPRWRANDFDTRATATLETILPRLNDEAVAEGRRRHWRSLVRAARRAAAERNRNEADDELFELVEQRDGYGLDRWCFLYEGRDEEPFVDLRQNRPALWEELVSAFEFRHSGSEP